MAHHSGFVSSRHAKGFPKYQVMAYVAPLGAMSFLIAPLQLIAVIYAKYFGLALTTIATVMLVTRIFDALTDPLIASYSDLYRRKHGTRKPFVLMGALCSMVCLYFLCVPSGGGSVVYFTCWYFAYYFFYTIYAIPMSAWAIEVTNDPKSRAFLFSMQVFLIKLGGVLFYAIPFLPIFATTEYTPETIKVIVACGIALTLPALIMALKYVPDGPYLKNETQLNIQTDNQGMTQVKLELDRFKHDFFEFLFAAKQNKPFLTYLAAAFFYAIGGGMFSGLFFLYIDAFLGMGDQFASVGILGLFFSLLITPVCYTLIIRWGKKTIWVMSNSVLLCGYFYSGLVSPETASFSTLLVIQSSLMLSAGFSAVVMPAAYADILDYGSLLDATDRKAMYVSITGFLLKAETALAASLGFWIAGYFGFDSTATTHTEQSSFAIRLAMSWVPLVIMSFSLFFIWKMPLNDRRNEIIRRRLNARAVRAAAI